MYRTTQDRRLHHTDGNCARVAELRHRIAVLEGRLPFETQFGPAPAAAANRQGPALLPSGPELVSGSVSAETPGQKPSRVPLGIQALDHLFTGKAGLRFGALHEVVSSESRNAGSISGFALALTARLLEARTGPVLWVQDARAVQENGRLHGPGLLRFGIDPARLFLVQPLRMEELLWALEEGASCPALSAVVGEVQGQHRALDLTATRRLALRAERSGVPVVLLRHAAADEPTAALTRWHVEPDASEAPALEAGGPHEAVGDPVWTARLTRNRDGRPGHLTVEWQHAGRKFAAPARSLALVRGSARGPDPAPPEVGIVRWRARG